MFAAFSTIRAQTKSLFPLLFVLVTAHSTIAQNTGTSEPSQNGWIPNNPIEHETPPHWLKQHGRFAIIVVIGSVILGLLMWYIIRSIKGMRKRLREENEKHFFMVQQMASASGPSPTTPQHYPTPPDSAHQSSIPQLKKSSTIYQTAIETLPTSKLQTQPQQHY